MAGVMMSPMLVAFLMLLMRMRAGVAGFGRNGVLRDGGVLGGGNRLVSGSFRHVRLLLGWFALTGIKFIKCLRPENNTGLELKLIISQRLISWDNC